MNTTENTLIDAWTTCILPLTQRPRPLDADFVVASNESRNLTQQELPMPSPQKPARGGRSGGKGRQPTDGAERSGGRPAAGTVLLSKLIAEPGFLWREHCLLEDELATETGVSKPALRESLIWFLRTGLLKRKPQGICRDELSASRLGALTSMRLIIERSTFRRVMEDPRSDEIAEDLRLAIRRHQVLAADDRTAAEWYLRTVDDLHVEIVQRAGLGDIGRLLRNIILQVRIGTNASLGTAADREAIGVEHIELVDWLGKGGTWDEASEIQLQQHLARIWCGALDRLGADSSERREEKWNRILTTFDCPPTSDSLIRSVFAD